MYGDGYGFVPDELRDDAEVLILGQNPGEMEELGKRVVGYTDGLPDTVPDRPRPLIGPTGFQLERTYLPAAGLKREQVSLANVLRCRLRLNDGRRSNNLPSGKVLKQAMDHCRTAHERIPAATRLIIAMGALAWRALGGKGSISDWRGYVWQK